jgi:hypothetical protein
MRALRILLAILLLTAPVSARKQDVPPSPDWTSLARLPPGRCIAVMGPDQRLVKARLVRWSASEILLDAGRGGSISLPREQIRKVGLYRSCGSAKAASYGAIFGFSIGFGATAIGTGSLCLDCADGETGLLGALVVGATVGVISAIVAWRSSDQPARWVYQQP